MTSRPARRRPTINDVAAEAGVSRGTVSRVLNGGRWVSPDAQALVDAAIRKTGYRVNSHARSLVTSRTKTVAFLLTEPYDQLFDDPNFSVLMRQAATELADGDDSMILIMASSPDEQRRALDFIGAGHVDGVLLVSAHGSGSAFVAAILDVGVPTIACGVPLGLERRMSYVTADDEHAAYLLTSPLQERGRSRIAAIAGPQDTAGARARLVGFRAAQGDDFDPELVAYGDYTRVSGAAAMRELLSTRPDLDAVFAANDRMAAGAVDVLAEHGRRVPDDVAVAGFDDAPIAARTTPPLTTMRQPFTRISQEMVRLLRQQLAGGETASIVLPATLVVREST